MRTRIAIVSTLVGLVTSCAAAPTSRYPDFDLAVMGEATSPELAAQLRAELPALTPTAFRSEDGALAGTVLASGPVEASKAARGYMVNVGLAGAEPLRCTVQDGVLGLSAFARSLAQAFLATYDAHELKYAFAGTNGSLPYLVVHGQYINRKAGGADRRTGFLKMVVAGHSEVTVACFHDQFGYRETVERVALSLAKELTLVRDKPLQPLVRRSVYALRDDAGQAVGSREVVIRVDAEDFRRSWIRTAFLSIRSPQQLHAKDVLETYDSDPDGRVFAQTYQVRENGEIRAELSLEEKPMTDYAVSGHVDQKPADSRFTAPEGLPDLLLAGAYRLSQKSFARFLPELSADQPTPIVVEQKAPAAKVKLGPRVITGQLDAAGDWVTGTQSDGFSFERTALEQ